MSSVTYHLRTTLLLSSTYFVVEVGEVHRFGTAEQLACWAGITPRFHELDRTARCGHISKEGCALVRWAAVEAVQRQCEPAVWP
jgi:transposase